MRTLFTGLLVSYFAFVFNHYLVSRFGNWVIVYIIPISEEFLKTGFYYLLGGKLITIHLIFGFIEGIFDFVDNKIAAFAAILSHLLFAYITLFIWTITDKLLLAILVSALVHSIWNYLIGRIIV
ncbi:hypothetical protein [Orenia marismortui]|uniref:CAAX prenyl protease-like protein n=1 Tax=Orenia marismortui TaxID=46469 RepID=A0A4R8H0C1_9FIRM|nr:hypothetical protein [Orenia marismortui]TDX51263.1 hypothetical protein C7959_11411 [Orenia marismortui]